MSPVRSVIVVGAGVNGLCTAWQLARRGVEQVTVVERHEPGHDRGSSHGKSRITRSSYHHPVYIEMVAVAHREEWPTLERAAGTTLLHRSPSCFFGPDCELYRTFVHTVESSGADVARIGVEEARSRFPQFAFPDAVGVLDDRTAGLIAAETSMEALVRVCRDLGVELLTGTEVAGLDLTGDRVRLLTRGAAGAGAAETGLQAERVVVTAGPWSPRLFPFLERRVIPVRQTVGYFEMDGDPSGFALGRFPVWAYLGPGRNNMLYGLPEFQRRGVKVARHVVSDQPDDPDVAVDAPDPEAVADLEHFVARQFTGAARLVDTEHCFYSNTDDEDFVLDLHPEDPRVVIGAGFSGHGFKLAPVTGRILSDLAVDGTCALPPFEKYRDRFRVPGSEGQP